MGTPAKWAPPDPKSLVKQSSQRPHFASDLRTLQRYGAGTSITRIALRHIRKGEGLAPPAAAG